MAIDLLADEPEGVDLLADEPTTKTFAKQKSYYDLSNEDQAKAMDLARKQISAQYPNMPTWLRDMMLTITPKNESPRLQKIANESEANTNFIPATAGGLLQGFAFPFQGVSSMLPGNIAKAVTDTDYTSYFPQPKSDEEKLLQGAGEIGGSIAPLGKLFGMLKGGAQLARIPKFLQNATALAGTGAIATPGNTDDKIMGALEGLGLGAAGKVASKVGKVIGTKVPAFLRGLTNESTPEKLVQSVQKPHDVLSNTASQLYGYVKDAIKKRNISIPIKPEYVHQAEEILPKTRATRKMIHDAKTGDYNAVHDLQSHLYKSGTKGLASDDLAISNQGEEIIDLRNKINDDLKDHFIQSGNVDIAHVLDQGKGAYKKLMDTYFNKNLPNGIGKMVHSELRLVPENPEELFTQNSKPMKKFLQQHPETAKHVKGIQEKEAVKKALNKLLWGSGGVAVGITGTKTLYDLLK